MNAKEVAEHLRGWARIGEHHERADCEYAAADLIESLQAQFELSRERERAAVHDIELVLNGAGVCHICANGDCKDGEHCEPKWRGTGEGEKE